MSNNFIKEILITLINKILDSYENIKYPFRAVMIKANYCYCCDKNNNETFFLRENSFSGNFKNNSWIYCKDCEIYVNLANKYYYNNTKYIQYDKSSLLENYNYSFYRVSSNVTVKPYIQKKCYFNFRNGDYIKEYFNRVSVLISWKSYNELCKNIPLSNLIFYNRQIFGYKYNKFPLKDIPIKWHKLITNEYNISNEWYNLHLILNKKTYFPKEILNIIFRFWNDLYQF